MPDSQKITSYDRKVRLHVYDHFIKSGRAPTLAEAAEALTSAASEVQAAYQRLADGKALVLQGNGDILMAEPFSAVPTPFVVESGKRSWWANCIWDALGVPAMLKEDARILTSCGCCGDVMTLEVKEKKLLDSSGVAHFAIPARDWWKNVVFT
jgi:hypothetical protein